MGWLGYVALFYAFVSGFDLAGFFIKSEPKYLILAAVFLIFAIVCAVVAQKDRG